MAAHDSTTNKLRQVNSERITTHKAAINPLISHYELADTISQVSAIITLIQALSLVSDDEKGIHLQADAVTGLYYVLQIVIETLGYVCKCESILDTHSPYVLQPMNQTDN